MAESKKKDRYRNPANDLVDAAVGGTKKAARAAGSTTKKSLKAAQTAGGRTVKRQEQQEQQGVGLRGRRKRQEEKTKATKPTPKPAAKPAAKPKPKDDKPALSSEGVRDWAGTGRTAVPTGSRTYNNWRNNRIEAERERLKNVGNPPAKPSPAPSTSRPSTSTSSRSSGSTSSTPKPAGKVPSSTAGMKNQDKNFRGNEARKDSIASTLRELRGMGSGRKVSGVGPVASGSDYAKSKDISQAQSDANKARVKQGPPAPKKESLKERMERMKKRRQGTAWGGVD